MARSKSRRSFSSEFRAEGVKLVLEEGLTQSKVAQDLGLGQSLLSKWVRKARSEAESGGVSSPERDELSRLRKENKVLKMERGILKKAAAFFAREM